MLSRNAVLMYFFFSGRSECPSKHLCKMELKEKLSVVQKRSWHALFFHNMHFFILFCLYLTRKNRMYLCATMFCSHARTYSVISHQSKHICLLKYWIFLTAKTSKILSCNCLRHTLSAAILVCHRTAHVPAPNYNSAPTKQSSSMPPQSLITHSCYSSQPEFSRSH